MRFSTRFQNRYDGTYVDRSSNRYSDNFYLRRARFKFDGFVLSPRIQYKIEYAIESDEMLDAVIKWNFYKNFTIWYGQTKLPGNVERVISSQKLQFVDRSLLNSRFNLDRDKGLQLHHHHTFGNVLVREKIAVSQGEGRNFGRQANNVGNDYTGRIEILPFGQFASKGEYFSADLEREKSPKLMLGFTFDYNDDALKSRGQLGNVLTEPRDIQAYFADMVLKYNGVALLAEYVTKTSQNKSPAIYDENNEFLGTFYTGEAVNAQIGYLFKWNVELAYRYTALFPEKETLNTDVVQHTVAVSRYIVGHHLKIQSDVSLKQEIQQDDEYQFRLQVELSF
jgi:phosphate-selective porin OprO/OprP